MSLRLKTILERPAVQIITGRELRRDLGRSVRALGARIVFSNMVPLGPNGRPPISNVDPTKLTNVHMSSAAGAVPVAGSGSAAGGVVIVPSEYQPDQAGVKLADLALNRFFNRHPTPPKTVAKQLVRYGKKLALAALQTIFTLSTYGYLGAIFFTSTPAGVSFGLIFSLFPTIITQAVKYGRKSSTEKALRALINKPDTLEALAYQLVAVEKINKTASQRVLAKIKVPARIEIDNLMKAYKLADRLAAVTTLVPKDIDEMRRRLASLDPKMKVAIYLQARLDATSAISPLPPAEVKSLSGGAEGEIEFPGAANSSQLPNWRPRQELLYQVDSTLSRFIKRHPLPAETGREKLGKAGKISGLILAQAVSTWRAFPLLGAIFFASTTPILGFGFFLSLLPTAIALSVIKLRKNSSQKGLLALTAKPETLEAMAFKLPEIENSHGEATVNKIMDALQHEKTTFPPGSLSSEWLEGFELKCPIIVHATKALGDILTAQALARELENAPALTDENKQKITAVLDKLDANSRVAVYLQTRLDAVPDTQPSLSDSLNSNDQGTVSETLDKIIFKDLDIPEDQKQRIVASLATIPNRYPRLGIRALDILEQRLSAEWNQSMAQLIKKEIPTPAEINPLNGDDYSMDEFLDRVRNGSLPVKLWFLKAIIYRALFFSNGSHHREAITIVNAFENVDELREAAQAAFHRLSSLGRQSSFLVARGGFPVSPAIEVPATKKDALRLIIGVEAIIFDETQARALRTDQLDRLSNQLDTIRKEFSNDGDITNLMALIASKLSEIILGENNNGDR